MLEEVYIKDEPEEQQAVASTRGNNTHRMLRRKGPEVHYLHEEPNGLEENFLRKHKMDSDNEQVERDEEYTKRSSKWSTNSKEVEKLIKEVKKHSILYAKNKRDNKNIYKRKQAWKTISKATGMSESDCRVRWKSLRDRYLRECKMKMEEAVDSGSETTEWQWRFFKSLEFLHDHLMPKEKTSNISKKRQHADKLKAESDSELSNSEEYIIDSNEAKVDKLLIKEVRNHKILYVQRHLEFKNDAKRAQAWQSISKSVGFPVSYCQTRWKCLRYRFVKEYRKICHSMDSSSNQILGSQWPFYESMSFLCDHVVPRRKLSYISSLQQAPTVIYELSDDETEPTNVEVLHSEDSLNGTDTLSDLLIEEVKKHEVLYSRNNPYHKNKVKRAEAWVAISSCVGMTELDCQTRWRSMRDRYVRECKKIRNNEITESQWHLFNNMSFLCDQLGPKRKSSSIKKSLQNSVDKFDDAEPNTELLSSQVSEIDNEEPESQTHLLIEEVRKHQCLYVKKHPDYKNKVIRADAWASISKCVGMTVSYCQTRWKCLRYRFVKEYRKICHSMDSSSNQILGSQWPFYESMSFLCDHVVPRRKLSYISSLQQAPTVIYELSDDETEPTNVEVLHSEDSLNGTDTLSDLLIEEVKKHEVLYSRNNPYHKNKVKRAEAWVAISSCVGMTELDCQTRWRSMRDRYVRECKKIRNNEITESQWHLFNNMSFLCDQLGPKRKSSSIKKSLQNSVDKFDDAEPNTELLSSQVSEIDNEEPESQTHLLIEEVRKHQCLYVKKHPDYKNKVIRADAWASISKCVGMTESECQTRWKSMRDHYVREYKKIHASQITESQYHSFDSMSFLDDQVAVKKIKSRSISEGSDIYNEELEPQSDILLIEEVKKHEFLYVRKHPDHCNRVKRAKAWISISKCVGLTESECSTRWKSMRDRYVREYNKIRFNEISESQWYLFDSMSFISDQVVCKRKSSSFIQQLQDNSVDGTDDDESNTEISKVSEMYNEEPESHSDILLIKEVKKHKLLYVRKHPQYGNKVKRAMAWVSISKSVGMEVSECQTRWKTMRDHFVRDYNKIRGNEITESQWYLFDSMRFLCDQVTPRAIISRSISEGSEIYNEEPEPQSDILLIKEVKKHKLLYIKKHPDHCNSVKRAEAWVSISKGVGMKECYCNRRWKTLRDRYVRNYKKILNNEITECQWNLFHSMSFLCDQVEYRIKSSSFIQESQDNTVDEFDDSEPNAEILISKVSEMYDEDPESQSDILLIEEVKKHELLYARKHGEYCNKVKRAMAWVSISKCVGIPESDCYTRWKSLRDRYVRDYKKICANEITESQWNLFDRLSFLCDHVAPKWILSRPPKKQEALHNFNVKFDEAEPITEDGAEPNTEGSEMYNEESEPMVEVLIEEVKKNKLIYAKDHPDNKNRSKREQAWQTISRSCGLPVHVCKARWKSLRDYYAKEFHQIQDALKEGYQALESGWYLFKTMDFLRGHATRRKKKEPAPTPANKEFDNDDELNVEMLITEDSVVDYDAAVAQSPPIYEYIEEQTQRQTPKHESHPNTNWYRKRSSSYNDVLDEFPDEMSATAEKRLCIEAKEAPNDNENTHEGFFLMIRELFKKMLEEDVDDSKIYFLNYLHAKIKKKCS